MQASPATQQQPPPPPPPTLPPTNNDDNDDDEDDDDDDTPLTDINQYMANATAIGVPAANFIDLTNDSDDEVRIKVEEVDENFNYIVWRYHIISGTTTKKHNGIFPWRMPRIQVKGKKLMERHKDFRWKCTFTGCPKDYATKTILWNHITDDHLFDEKSYECAVDDCLRSFSHRSGVLDHIKRDHMDGKQFECKRCGKEHQNATAARRCARRCQGRR